MSAFKYIGSFTKENGKVDVIMGATSFLDVTPGVFEIVVSDGSQEEIALLQAKDPFHGALLYSKQV